jgi:aryl-alcohol dehydrogenase-like predicted oxidoreductase
MEYRTLGLSGIRVSVIGFGCWTMGGPNWSPANGQPIGWADVDEADVLAGIKAGLDAGVNHWDNADVYGNGKAERLLGSCLRKLGVKRDTQVIATKVGHMKGTAPHGLDPHHVRSQCEQSLRNLRVDHIDLYYFHHASFVGPDVDGKQHDYLYEAAAVMHDLVKQGKVRAIGQSGYSYDDFARCVPVVKPHALQAKANLRYDEFIAPGSNMQKLMTQHNCPLVCFGPLDQGILLDKFDPDNPPKWSEGEYRASRKDFAPATLRKVRESLSHVRASIKQGQLGFAPGSQDTIESLSSVAQRWLLAHPNVCSVIPGFRNASQARCNVAAAKHHAMSGADVEKLRGVFAGVKAG